MKNKEYVVKYLGIVEGNVGCLSRKMNMPNKVISEHPVGTGVSALRQIRRSTGREFTQPVLRSKYKGGAAVK